MSQKKPAVDLQEPFVASAKGFKAAAILPALPSPTGRSALTFITIEHAENFLYAPVKERSRSAAIQQRSTDGWDRNLDPVTTVNVDYWDSPIIIGGRDTWTLHEDSITIIGQASIIDGAKRINGLLSLRKAAVARGLEQEVNSLAIPATVYLQTSDEEDLNRRMSLLQINASEELNQRMKIETNTERLTIGTTWSNVSLESDPFVVKTALGYGAAINVRTTTGQLKHILCSAKSLSSALEAERLARGSLVGLRLKLRKESDDPRSAYLVALEEG